jgi:acetyl esterase/lipase
MSMNVFVGAFFVRAFVASVAAMTVIPAALAAGAALSPPTAAKPVLEDRYPERQTTFPGDVVGLADLTYESLVGYRPLKLDVYRPKSLSSAHPLVVYVHGGGWQGGHTRHSGAFENWPEVLASIAARGYVVASVEYRLSGEARSPAAIQDVKAAIRWLRTHAQQFGIDKQRAVIWGGSAGGQLAALAGTSCGVAALEPAGTEAAQRPEPGARAGAAPRAAGQAASATALESDCVQGVIAWYGIFDFSTLDSSGTEGPARYLGCNSGKCPPGSVAAASAVTYLDAKDPPFLMIHGVDDHTVPIRQSRDFLAALRAKGVRGELIEIPGVDHSFIGATPEATRAASLKALNASIDFLDALFVTGKN